MSTGRPPATGLAVLFLLLLLAALGARLWAADRITALGGPTHIAADDRRVMLFAAGQLFHLSADGELLAAIPIERAGLADHPVDLRWTGDGGLLVAGQPPARNMRMRRPSWSSITRLRGAEDRVDLPADADATDLAASGASVLVTDMDRVDVYRVAGDSLQVESFGDNRWTRPPAPFDWAAAAESMPRTSGIHWLERDPATERSLRWAERISYILLPLPAVLGLAVFFVFYAQVGRDAPADIESKMRELGLALLLVTALLAPMIPLVRSAMQRMRIRLGRDVRRLYIRRHDGREFAADPAQLACTDRMIFFQEHQLPLTGGRRRSLYRPGEVETWLAPLLRQARKLSPREALEHQWRHRDSRRFWSLFLAVALGTVLLAIVFGL